MLDIDSKFTHHSGVRYKFGLREIVATPALMLVGSLFAGGVIAMVAAAVIALIQAFGAGGGIENIAS